MQARRTAEAQQGRAARVLATLYGYAANGPLHVGLHYPEHALGCTFGRQAAHALAQSGHHPACPLKINRYFTAEQSAAGESPEQRVGIGYRGFVSSPVTGGAGRGTRARRSYLERAAGVDRRYRTATGAHRVNVHGRAAQREATDDGGVGERDSPVDQRDVGGGAPHVERHGLLKVGCAHDLEGRRDSARWPREHAANRLTAHRLYAQAATRGLHDAKIGRAALQREVFEVPFHPRAHEGIGHRGRSALVLSGFGRELLRKGHRYAELAQGLTHGFFVGRVDVRVQQAHGYRFDPRSSQLSDQLVESRLVGAQQGFAVGRASFGQAEAHVFCQQGLLASRLQLVEFRAGLSADFEQVFETRGGDQCGARALSLQHRVGGNGGAVAQAVGRRSVEQARQGIEYRAAGVVRRGQQLAPTAATVRTAVDHVGESSTGVYAYLESALSIALHAFDSTAGPWRRALPAPRVAVSGSQ